MAIGSSTPNQRTILQPYTQRLFSGDVNYTKSYIYNYVNQLTELIGTDQVVLGCSVNSSSFTNTDISVEINSGYLLHDKAFVDITSNVTLTYPNASSFDESGAFIIFTRFKNYHTHDFHKLQVCMTYIDSGGNPFEDFNSNTDRIILCIINFTKDLSGNLDSITVSQDSSIVIDGVTYESYPRTELYIVDGGQLPFL